MWTNAGAIAPPSSEKRVPWRLNKAYRIILVCKKINYVVFSPFSFPASFTAVKTLSVATSFPFLSKLF